MPEIELLRQLYPEAPAASVGARARARTLMTERINDPTPAWRRPFSRPVPLLAASLVGLAVCGILVVVFAMGERQTTDPGAQALLEAAETARQQPVLEIPRDGHLYLRTVKGRVVKGGRGIPLLESKLIERWIGESDSSSRITPRRPEFLSPEDRRRWLALGMPLPGIPAGGPQRTPTEPGQSLTSDPDELFDRLRREEERQPGGSDQAAFALIGESLSNPLVPPAQRAALYEAAAQIPGVELVARRVRDRAGRQGVAVGVSSESNGVRETLIFDPETAVLLSKERVTLPGNELGYPPGKTISYSSYSHAIVDSSGKRTSLVKRSRSNPESTIDLDPYEGDNSLPRTRPSPTTRTGEHSSKQSTGAGDDSAKRLAAEADRAKAALAAIYRSLRASDVAAVCEAMTPAAQRQMAASSPKESENCEQAFGRYYAFAERDSPEFRRALKGEVVSARVEGDRAVVAVRFPRKNALSPVLLVKDDGAWKLPGVPTVKED